ncbi:hypothetical protein OF83DRAFT_1145216 [Amylostereum chailletii]|nr:hypothetical protein OF83DRAFT_1145216 [Amylostereum chailletii]
MRDLAESKRTRSQFLSKIIKDGLYHIHSMASRVAEGAQARFGRKALGLSKGLSTADANHGSVHGFNRKEHEERQTKDWSFPCCVPEEEAWEAAMDAFDGAAEAFDNIMDHHIFDIGLKSKPDHAPALSALAEVSNSAEDGFVTASMAFEDAHALPHVSHAFMMTADALGVVTELLELVHSSRQCTGYQAQIVVEDRLRVMSQALNRFKEAAAAFAGTVFRSTVVDALMSAGNVVQGLLLWTSSHTWVVCDTGDRDAAKDDDTAVPDIATVQDGLRFDLALVATKFADVAEAYRWGFEPEEQPADKEELTRPHDSTPAIAPSSTPDPSSPPNHPYQPYSDWNILPSSSPPPEARSTEPSHFVPPPDPALCKVALQKIMSKLKPRQGDGKGYAPFEGDNLLHERLRMLATFLRAYTSSSASSLEPADSLGWIQSSVEVAHLHGKSEHTAHQLRRWARAFLDNENNLPVNIYGTWNTSLLDNEDLRYELGLHLQSIGKYVAARDIINFVNTEEARIKFGFTRTISLRTAQRWMHDLGYRWKRTPHGQYIDSHERTDVTSYRDDAAREKQRVWAQDGQLEAEPVLGEGEKVVVKWFHDETHFSANDRHEKPVPRAKTEGAMLMIADFVSADRGWLGSPDGSANTRNRDGYFSNDDILTHATAAMDILDAHYPHEQHLFIFDNATTHRKRPDDALSAPLGKPMFGVSTTVTNEHGNPKKIRMGDGTFADGMLEILVKHGFDHTQLSALRTECPKFKCPVAFNPSAPCCCRRLLFNQPDFADIPSILETHCRKRGYDVVFLPKFHCELNFIEQCWGRSKAIYRDFPASSREADLERNTVAALGTVPLISMRRFANRSERFEDAYIRGLNGKQAAWAAKKYRGHRVLPDNIMETMEEEGVTKE